MIGEACQPLGGLYLETRCGCGVLLFGFRLLAFLKSTLVPSVQVDESGEPGAPAFSHYAGFECSYGYTEVRLTGGHIRLSLSWSLSPAFRTALLAGRGGIQ